MPSHAIKAGEGDVFISAGVECVSRFTTGSSDSWPDTHSPVFAEAEARSVERSGAGAEAWHDPRCLRRDGPNRGERRATARSQPPGPGRVRRAVAEPRREGAG